MLFLITDWCRKARFQGDYIRFLRLSEQCQLSRREDPLNAVISIEAELSHSDYMIRSHMQLKLTIFMVQKYGILQMGPYFHDECERLIRRCITYYEK